MKSVYWEQSKAFLYWNTMTHVYNRHPDSRLVTKAGASIDWNTHAFFPDIDKFFHICQASSAPVECLRSFIFR